MTQKFNVRRTSRPQIYAAKVTRPAAIIARPNLLKFKILADFKLLAFQNPQFTILAALKSLGDF